MAQPKWTHMALHVRDIAASTAFYTRYARMHVVDDRMDVETNLRTVWLSSEAGAAAFRFVLVLLEGIPAQFGTLPPQAPIGPLSHFGFAVASREDVEAIAEEGRAAGILLKPPAFINPVVGYLCYLRDPDGHSVEFSFGQKLG